MLVKIIVLFVLLRQSCAVIYRLNESEYHMMPPLFTLDDYPRCMVDPGAVFCLADFALYSERPSQLMTMIKEYSDYKLKHFNHTVIHRGLCLHRTCKDHLKSSNISEDLNNTLGACINASVWQEYGLQAKLQEVKYCLHKDDKIQLDRSDLIMAAVYVIIVLLNAVGTFYDLKICQDEKSGNPFILAFSIRRNWRRLTAPAERGQDPRLDRLKLFNGIRTLTMVCVFFSHTTLIIGYSYVENPLFLEKSYDNILMMILMNGSLVTYSFFVMSAFLLAYNMQLLSEKTKISWMYWPKGMMLRWLRLTPVYGFILATVSTWMRHVGSGPLWQLTVTDEAVACRQYWWAHILYINNYIYEDAFCAPQTWYLASDTQLFGLGLLLCVVARTPRAQKVGLMIMFFFSLLFPALHTYFQDLDAIVMQSPETYRSLYAHDDTFRIRYARGHTNMSTYTVGLAGGFLVYYWQKAGKDFTAYRKYRLFYWLLFPLGVGVILSGGIFYADGPRAPVVYRILYNIFYKPLFQFLIVTIIIGCIFKYDNVYRPILEWRGFTWTGRVSYSAFLMHTLLQRTMYGLLTTTIRMTNVFIITLLAATIFMSFGTAVILWLMVEAPCSQLVSVVMAPKKRHLEKNIVTAAAANENVEGQSKL